MRKGLVLGMLAASSLGLTIFACSGDDASQGAPDSTDAASDTNVVANDAAGDAGACPPATSVDPSKVKWVPPHAPQPTACSDAQIEAIYNTCYSGSTIATAPCQALLASADFAACNACMFSTYGEGSSYGAIIHIGDIDTTNFEGCYGLLLGDISATGCAAKMQNADECEILACTSCELTNGTAVGEQEWTTCQNTASTGACATYDLANCGFSDGGVPDGGTAYQKCLGGTSFKETYETTARLFCGGYVSDAGADSGTDAGDD